MGDLAVNEAFLDKVFIANKVTGTPVTGLTPTCTIIDESGNRTVGNVTELGYGWYGCLWIPDAEGTWATEWRGIDLSAYVVYFAYKIFKVGGGVLDKIDKKIDELEFSTPENIWQHESRTLTDKAGFTIAGAKQTLDALNDLSLEDIESSGVVAKESTVQLIKTETDKISDIKSKTDLIVPDGATESNVNSLKINLDAKVSDVKVQTDNIPHIKTQVDYIVNNGALEATLTAIKGSGWSTETLKNIREAISALNNIAVSDVWNYSPRTLTNVDNVWAVANRSLTDKANFTLASSEYDNIRKSVCVTDDPSDSIGKILFDLYGRLTSARAGYLDNINNANLATLPAISSTRIGYLDFLNSDAKYLVTTGMSTPASGSIGKVVQDTYNFLLAYLNQAVKTTSSPTFAGLTLTGFSGIVKATGGTLSASALTSGEIPSLDASKITSGIFSEARIPKTLSDLFLINPFIDAWGSDYGNVLCLDFEEGIGNKVFDQSPYSNDGTIYGASWVDGKYGKALSFDGVDDYVHFGDILRFEGRAPFSVAFRIYDTGFTGFFDRVVSKEKLAAPREGWLIARQSTANVYLFQRFQAGTSNFVTTSYTPNQWNFIVFTYDGSVMRSYLNGNFISSVASTLEIQPTTTPFRIGRISDETSYLRGILDEVRIYNRALTAEEIRTHYLNTKGMYTRSVVVSNKYRILKSDLSVIFALDDNGKITHGSADANLITTGVFNVARIPSLDTSKITSGVFDTARIPWTSVPASGIVIGGDTNLYRSTADVLRTDDVFQAGGYRSSDGSGGITQNVYILGNNNVTHNLMFKNGLLVSYYTT